MKKYLLLLLLVVVSSCTAVKTVLPIGIIDQINKEVNKVPYVSDWDNYNQPHHVATPEEFYKNGGDCEDYVIAKIRRLLDAGVPEDAMRVVLGRTPYFGYHTVLEVKANGTKYILDNQSNSLENVKYLYGQFSDPKLIFLKVSELYKLSGK